MPDGNGEAVALEALLFLLLYSGCSVTLTAKTVDIFSHY
jgi:hypothetical protein